MTNVYALCVILTYENNSGYILSIDPNEIKLPIIQIENINYLHDEIRYKTRKFFSPSSFEFNEECDYNFLSVQNSLSINYLQSIDDSYYNDSLILTLGGILEKNSTENNMFWSKLVYDTDLQGFTNNKNLNLLIDNVINKTLF